MRHMHCRILSILWILQFFTALGFAQDKVYIRGTPTMGTITKVTDTSISMLLADKGEISFARNTIERIEIARPASLSTGVKALEAENFPGVIQSFEPIVSKYGGLPEPWLEEATLRLIEAYVNTKDWTKVKSLLADFRKYYPESRFQKILLLSEAGMLHATGQAQGAKTILENLMTQYEKEEAPSDDENRALGKACVTLAKCYLSEQQKEKALETFLKVTTLYYMDASAVAEAQYQSALLFEGMGAIIRARGQLEDLIRDFPTSPLLEDAKKKLASLPTPPKPDVKK